MKTHLIILMCLFGSRATFAQKIMFNAAVTQVSDESKRDTSRVNFNSTIYSAAIGLHGEQGLVGGLKYWSYDKKGTTAVSSRETIQTWGPLIGFIHKDTGVYLLGTWFIGPEKVAQDDVVKTTYSGGDGYLVEFGKMFHFNPSAAGGLQLAHSKVTYKDFKTEGGLSGSLNGNYEDSTLYPYISLFLFF